MASCSAMNEAAIVVSANLEPEMREGSYMFCLPGEFIGLWLFTVPATAPSLWPVVQGKYTTTVTVAGADVAYTPNRPNPNPKDSGGPPDTRRRVYMCSSVHNFNHFSRDTCYSNSALCRWLLYCLRKPRAGSRLSNANPNHKPDPNTNPNPNPNPNLPY